MIEVDRNLHAYRDDLADAALSDVVSSSRYVKGSIARIKRGIAAVYMEPDIRSVVQTHFHYGEVITTFEVGDEFCWCQSSRDRYVGYVKSMDIDQAPQSTSSRFVSNLGCYVYSKADLKFRPVDFLPLHSTVNLVGDVRKTRDTEYFETIDTYFIPGKCLSTEKYRHTDLCDNAMSYIGSPYLWGGRSSFGIDCSGLIQASCETAGIMTLRDTYMQKESIGYGVVVNVVSDLRRNDIIYCKGHAAIYDGNGNVVHADGISMSVISQPIVDFMLQRRLSLSDFIVRRL